MKAKSPTHTKAKPARAEQKAQSKTEDPKIDTGRGAGKKPANPPNTEGLTPFDQQRASSLADEGGSSAAAVEGELTARRKEWDFDGDSRSRPSMEGPIPTTPMSRP